MRNPEQKVTLCCTVCNKSWIDTIFSPGEEEHCEQEPLSALLITSQYVTECPYCGSIAKVDSKKLV